MVQPMYKYTDTHLGFIPTEVLVHKLRKTNQIFLLSMMELLFVSLIHGYHEWTWLTPLCLAYDLKMVIDKGIVDVIRPRWIFDSIEEGELVPMSKK